MTNLFRRLTEKDLFFLEKVLLESFNEDSERVFGKGYKNGPPGYDNGELAKKIVHNRQMTKLVIQINEMDCGVLIYHQEETYVVDYFCILPLYADKGLGSEVWRVFEEDKGGVWILETPDYSVRNHHFYKKNGFVKVAEKSYGPKAKSFIFKKEVKRISFKI